MGISRPQYGFRPAQYHNSPNLTDDPGNRHSIEFSYAQNAKIFSKRTAALRKTCAPEIEMGQCLKEPFEYRLAMLRTSTSLLCGTR